MSEQSGADKTEKATPRRREQSEEKGQLAKSMDLGQAVGLLVGIVAMRVFMGTFFQNLTDFIRYIYNNCSDIILTPASIPVYARFIVEFSITSFASILLCLLLAGIIVNVAQDKFRLRFFPKALELKFSALSPIKGIKKIFSLNSIVELIKGILKLSIIGFIAYSVIKKYVDLNHFWILYNTTTTEALVFFGKVFYEIGIKASVVLLILGLADFAYQKWQNEKKMKMTKQEVKDERKQYEGSPELKGKIRSKQMEISRGRMMAAVPDATVVVTNPTFIAIAILYAPQERSDAPKIVAKGKRKVAEKIKAIAIKNNVPIIEDKPLARSLFDVVEVGMEVPFLFYQAVAEVLAKVFSKNPKKNPLRI